ncbi:GCN5 family acetyltransferase [Methylomonas lenta]|uniref:GCN5 family acetyltransferase n=1 Tax=Methylomonas lenta TaxID=980561 RepID=A0A177NRR5_9GAMM|nr:GNAT family N-acetyltransferase [Methylomonas lenta]OAI20562.1 GCN5 family acetyltransferase [Methylomonas lenta]
MTIIDLMHEPQHIPILAAWHHQEWAHLNPGASLEKRIQKMQAYLSDEWLPSTYICKRGGQLIGSAAVVACDMDSRPELTPWLASVCVAPTFRCQGVGSKLVQHAMHQARQVGVGKLFLFTPDQERFYQALGWTTIAEEIYRDCSVKVMQAVLND